MTMQKSKLWSNITKSLFVDIDEEFVSSFRAPGGANARLAAWDPFDRSMRYYKFLLYNVAKSNPEFIEYYRELENVSIGNPVSVSISDVDINIDYLFSVEEFSFLNNNLDFDKIKSVAEIGAGFGRTCHTILTFAPSVLSYKIIDLPEVLKLSRLYLKKAIPLQYDKIEFIDCFDIKKSCAADLSINIDSFQEMLPEVIDYYMNEIIEKSGYFYCKNPTGKYTPDSVGLPELTAAQLHDVYSLGFCRDTIDLFDENKIIESAQKYLKAYMPKINLWELIANKPMEMFQYYHHALYKLV